MKKIICFGIVIFLFGLFLTPALATTTTPTFGDINKNIETSGKALGYDTSIDYTLFVAQIIQGALALVGTIFVILIIYGGFLWMTGETGADKGKLDKAKKVLKNSLLGLVIVVLAYAITTFVVSVVEKGAQSSSTPVETTGTP